MIKNIWFVCSFFVCLQLQSQETIKTMFYNLLEYPSASPGNRAIILNDILEEYQPDIFMVCELENEAGADQILNISLNYNNLPYARANFQNNTSGNANLQQLIYYRSDKFILESSAIIQTTVRDINEYVLTFTTENTSSDPINLNIYVSHLKSSQGSSNENLRLAMVSAFTDRLASLDPDTFVIFAGDLNVYDSDEPAYQELLDPTNAIVLVDPINAPGDWSNNEDFQELHTQSTRVSSSPFGAGAGGGLDDRFDFIMLSQNMLTDPKLKYIENSYKAYGNNGNCFNRDISDINCGGTFNQQTRNRLFGMSDHLPVILELETEENIVLASSDNYLQNKEVGIKNTLVTHRVQLNIPETLYPELSYNVYNTLGQEVYAISARNSHKELLPVQSLPEGLYFIKTNLINHKTLKFFKVSN